MRRTGWGFFVAFLLIGLVGNSLTHAQIYFRLSILCAAILAISYLWARISLLGVEVTVRNRSNKAHVGEVFDQTILVRNRSILPILYLEIADLSGLYGGPGSRLITWIGPKQNRSYTSHLRLIRRGHFQVGRKLISSGDPLRFFSNAREVEFGQDLIVYPATFPITNFNSVAGILKDGRLVRKRSIEPSVQFSEIRPYVPGDDLQKIHWISSRKLNKLMVKEFDQYLLEEAWCILDAAKASHWSLETPTQRLDPWVFAQKDQIKIPNDTFEYCVSTVASLAHVLLRRNIPVGMVTTTREPIRLAPETGSRQESKLMELLALAQPNGNEPLQNMAMRLAGGIRPGCTVLLVTTAGLNELLPAVMSLLNQKCRPMVFHISAGLAAELEQPVTANWPAQVPWCPIPLGADVRVVLEKFFASQRNPQYA